MRTITKQITISILAVAFCAMGTIAAQVPLVLGPESVLWLEGDSTLHPFSSRTQNFILSAEATTPAILDPGAVQQMKLKIPVKGLQSKEKALDKNMYKALSAEAHPEILFELLSYEVTPSTGRANAALIHAHGKLDISGKAQSVDLTALAASSEGGAGWRVQGEYPLKMTDYGVKPPSLMMGAIKVKDQVIIHFDLILKTGAP